MKSAVLKGTKEVCIHAGNVLKDSYFVFLKINTTLDFTGCKYLSSATNVLPLTLKANMCNIPKLYRQCFSPPSDFRWIRSSSTYRCATSKMLFCLLAIDQVIDWQQSSGVSDRGVVERTKKLTSYVALVAGQVVVLHGHRIGHRTHRRKAPMSGADATTTEQRRVGRYSIIISSPCIAASLFSLLTFADESEFYENFNSTLEV